MSPRKLSSVPALAIPNRISGRAASTNPIMIVIRLALGDIPSGITSSWLPACCDSNSRAALPTPRQHYVVAVLALGAADTRIRIFRVVGAWSCEKACRRRQELGQTDAEEEPIRLHGVSSSPFVEGMNRPADLHRPWIWENGCRGGLKEPAPPGGDPDCLRPVRAAERMLAKTDRGQGIRHLLRMLEPACGETEGQRPGQEGAGDGLPAAAREGAGTAGTQTGAGKAADDLG